MLSNRVSFIFKFIQRFLIQFSSFFLIFYSYKKFLVKLFQQFSLKLYVRRLAIASVENKHRVRDAFARRKNVVARRATS